jgi:hypothetical protein
VPYFHCFEDKKNQTQEEMVALTSSVNLNIFLCEIKTRVPTKKLTKKDTR